MSTHFQVPIEKISDDELSKGFSFHTRQANKEGQFSGPLPKSIVPVLHHGLSTSAPRPLVQRMPFEFAGLRFQNNIQKSFSDDHSQALVISEQVQSHLNENRDASPTFLRQGDQVEAQSDNEIDSACQPAQNSQQSSSPSTQVSKQPSQCCENQSLTSPRHDTRSPGGVHNDASRDISTTTPISDARRKPSSRNGHIQRHYSSQHCGDLEGFGFYAASDAAPTPPSRSRLIRRSHSRSRQLDLQSSVPRRTHSRASNISRKRPFAAADHHNENSEPDPKRIAMDQAVKHWNACIQLTTEESARAKSTIDILRKEIRDHATEVHAAKAALKDREDSFQKLQNRYEHIKARDSETSKEKGDLQGKLQVLKTDYDKLRAYVKDVSAKYHKCESELKNAISEQRGLCNKSKDSFIWLKEQIKTDAAQRRADSAFVDSALKASLQKREELKGIVDEMKLSNERQKLEYDHSIAGLAKDLESCRSLIGAEQQENQRLRDEIQSSRMTKNLTNTIEIQLKDLLGHLRALDKGQDANALELSDVNAKINTLPSMNSVAELKDQGLESHAKIDALESLIQTSLASSIEALASGQSKLQDLIESVANSLESSLGKLQDQVHAGAIDLGQRLTMGDEAQAQIANSLNLLSAGHENLSSRVESVTDRLENIAGSISPDGSIGAVIASILHSAKKSSESGEKLLTAQEQAQELTKECHEALASKIEARLLDQDIIQRELVAELKDRFEASLTKLQKGLETAWQASARSESAEQRQAGKKMLEDVETIRSKLNQVESQLSKMDGVPLSLEKIHGLSVLIQETSKYMEGEEEWIHQKFCEQTGGSSSEIMDKSTSESGSSRSSEYPCLDLGSSSQGSSGGDLSGSQVRRVTVHSPRPQAHSPQRVTAAQEQRRRRESAKPRSILKAAQCKASMAHGPGGPIQSSFSTSEEVIADIRSMLVEPPSERRIVGLTSMAEYMKSSKAPNRRPDHDTQIGDLADIGHVTGSAIGCTAIAAEV